MKNKIMDNVELQMGLTERLRDLDNPEGANLNAIKTFAATAGKLLQSMKLETEIREKNGLVMRENVRSFFGLEDVE